MYVSIMSRSFVHTLISDENLADVSFYDMQETIDAVFIKGKDGKMTTIQEDIVDRVLESQVLHDMTTEFIGRMLLNETYGIETDVPITNWHAVWDENITMTKDLKVRGLGF